MSQRMYVTVFTDSKGELNQAGKAIEGYTDGSVAELQESGRGQGSKYRGKFLVTGPVVADAADDPDAFVTYIWEEVGDYCWISINGTDQNGDFSEKYGKAEYKEMMG